MFNALNKYHIDLFITGLLLFYLIIFSFNPHVSPFEIAQLYDNKRIIEIFLLATILISILLNPSRFFAPKGTQLTINSACLLTILLLGVFSSLQAEFPHLALLEFSTFIALYLFAYYVSQVYRQYKIKIFYFITSVLLLSAIFFLTAFFFLCLVDLFETKTLNWQVLFFGFMHHRFFNQFQVWSFALMTLPLVLNITLNTNIRKLCLTLVSGWWFMLFTLGSRGAIIAIIVASGITLLVYRKSAYPMLRIQLYAGLIGFILYGIMFHALPTVLSVNEALSSQATSNPMLRYSSSGRLELWKQAIHFIRTSPFLGSGPMHYFGPATNPLLHPHNAILQWAAEYGIPSTVLMLTLCFSSLRHWLRRFNYTTLKTKPTSDAQLIIALFCTVTAGAIYSLVSGIIVMPLSQVMMAITIGLMLGIYQSYNIQLGEGNCNQNAWPQRMLAGSVLVVLVYTSLPGLLPRLGQKSYIPQGHANIYPRYWLHGEFQD